MPTINEALMHAAGRHQAGQLQEAEQIYRQVLAVDPANFDAWHLLGVLASQSGRLDEGIACLARAVQLQPGQVDPHINLGIALKDYNRLNDARAILQRAINLDRNRPDAWYNLGLVFQRQGLLEDAAKSYRQAVEIQPDYGDAHTNLGTVLVLQKQFDAALAHFRQALAINPSSREFHMNLASLLLRQGDFAGGWDEFEWRWKDGPPASAANVPFWDGSDLRGKTIVLQAEQGLGDTLQFIRYAPLIKQRGAAVVLESQSALVPLLSIVPLDQIIAKGTPWPASDYYAPLMSLPRIMQTRLDNIPASIPYISADPARVMKWRERLGGISGFKIAIGWQGNPAFPEDRERSIPLAEFAPLAELPGVKLVSLQKAAGTEQLTALGGKLGVLDLSAELDAQGGAFMDSAAIMKNVDLVVTSDTAVAHLAGALGVPVWMALSFMPHWRWLVDRSDCPWYPTMRLFRQPQAGDWPAVFRQIAAALAQLLAGSSGRLQ